MWRTQRWTGGAKHLVDRLAERLGAVDHAEHAVEKAILADQQVGASLGDLIPQGSFAHRTIINLVNGHEYDADVLLPFDEQPGWEPKDYVNELYNLLERNGTYAGKVTRRSRCVVIDFPKRSMSSWPVHGGMYVAVVADDARRRARRVERACRRSPRAG